MHLTATQLRKLNNLLRRSTRVTLGVPSYAPNAFVDATAIYNNLGERLVMHEEGETHRLTTSNQGRRLLELVGHNTTNLPLYHRQILHGTHFLTSTLDQYQNTCILKEMLQDASRAAADSFKVIRPHTAPMPALEPAKAEIVAITQAITQHEHASHEITVRTYSKAELRAFLQNQLPSDVLAQLTTYGLTISPY
ncbi:hypothetical protein HPB52_007886 [Rhipicephalus sanguineus]|uniref:Uncharacterized protein n=1 Tax=Rhipicephalus sanguineus TaxID=34632 RepID=A0A9D4SVX0_RHISA|nr:hypothetical protein HPB52_007886 [Rhipicephalus sanguineus]